MYLTVEFLRDLQDQSVPLMFSDQLVPQNLQFTHKLLDPDAARMFSSHQTVTLLKSNSAFLNQMFKSLIKLILAKLLV